MPSQPLTPLGPKDSHFNIGLLRSVLQPIRDLVVQQMSEAAYSFELGRAAMSAVVLLNCARAQKINDPAANGRLLSQSNAYFLQAVRCPKSSLAALAQPPPGHSPRRGTHPAGAST